MRVTVIKAGEAVPAPWRPARWARSGQLARALAARGHEVTWVVSSFDHVAKTEVYCADTTTAIAPGISLVALHARGYEGHRSPARLWHHHVLTRKLTRWLASTPRADLIVPSLPVPEMALVAVDHARLHRIPSVVDCRDMWPDTFREGRSGPLGALIQVATEPMARATRGACAGATAITGHTEAFVDWGLRQAGRARRPTDRAFPLGYPTESPDPAALREAEGELDALGIRKGRTALRLIFMGTLTRHFDLSPVIAAARAASAAGVAVEVVICGEGDQRARWEAESAGAGNVHWLGWRTAPFIWALLRRSDIGLAPYVPSPSFVQSVPNKICEYLSAGLPIVSTLPGESEPLLLRDGAGWRVAAGDGDALFALVQRLAARRDLVQEGGRRAALLFEERFRADQVYGAFAAHLEEIAAGRATVAGR